MGICARSEETIHHGLFHLANLIDPIDPDGTLGEVRQMGGGVDA